MRHENKIMEKMMMMMMIATIMIIIVMTITAIDSHDDAEFYNVILYMYGMKLYEHCLNSIDV